MFHRRNAAFSVERIADRKILNAKRYLLSAKKGFTLVEIMIVVTIMGILAAVVVPYYVRAREEAKANACICNLKEIEGAKERWAISMDVDRWAVPDWTELVPDFLKSEPHCPAGGAYTVGDSDAIPTCDIGTNDTAEKYDDHILYSK